MNSYRATSQPACIGLSRLTSPAPLTGRALVAVPAPARPAQLSELRTSWSRAGLMPVRTTATTPLHLGGAIAIVGGVDVTDPKFSTRVGPPSCSPPV